MPAPTPPNQPRHPISCIAHCRLGPAPRNVLIAVGISSDMEVVDLCSGDGWFTLQMAKLARSVIAIDIDFELLKVAQARLIENKVTNCTFIAGDAYYVEKLIRLNWHQRPRDETIVLGEPRGPRTELGQVCVPSVRIGPPKRLMLSKEGLTAQVSTETTGHLGMSVIFSAIWMT